MISSVVLNNELTRKLNRVDSQYGKALSIQVKDALINEAKDLVYENFIIRPEWNQLIRSHLRQLEVKRKVLPSTPASGYVVAEFPTNYFRYLRCTILGTTKTCNKKIELVVRLVPSEKISETLKSTNTSPSIQWEETIADEGEDGLMIWHLDNFIPGEIQMDYMKKLPDVYAPSLLSGSTVYKNPAGEIITEDEDLLIDSTALWRKIVVVAELMARRDLGDMEGYQTGMKHVFELDRAYV